MKRRLTFANGTALLALFFALSAGSYAATLLPANSVTGKQVKDHSLLKKDFKTGQLPKGTRGAAGAPGLQGAQGLQGAPGAQGAQGPAGPVAISTLARADGPQTPVGANGSATDIAASVATCPSGQKVVSGGSDSFTGGIGAYGSIPSTDRNSWIVMVYNTSAYGGGYVQAFANCATSGQAVAARRTAATPSRATRQQVRHAIQRLRARVAKVG
jgi:hypothetical protein